MKPMYVVFRVFKDGGDVIAFFPKQVHPNGLVTSYQHVGQHSLASYPHDGTRAAIPVEYADLYAELRSIGYKLRVVKG